MSSVFSQKKWQKIFLSLTFLFLVSFLLIIPFKQILAEGETEGHPIVLGGGMMTLYEAYSVAEAACPGPVAGTQAPCVPKVTKKWADLTIKERMIPLLKAAAINLVVSTSQYVLDRIAYEAAIWVATGGEGETPLFESSSPEAAWKSFGLDVVGNAIGSLSKDLDDYLDTDFNLCAPANPMFRIGLAIGLKSAFQPPKPICDWQSISNNWQGWYQTISETAESPSEAVLNAVAKGLRPGQNTLSYFATVNLRVKQAAVEKKGSLFAQYINDSGFQNLTNVVTGQVTTPATYVREHLSTQINKAQEGDIEASREAALNNADILPMILTHTTSVFVNTLLSEWLQKWKEGLFDITPLSSIDVFDDLSLNDSGSKKEAEEFYADVVAVTPTALDDYSILSEFVICPGPESRQMNNCVMDSSFASAISKSGPTDLMTVSKAIEQGLINDGWPLYSSDDLSHNQDFNCYTYGFCYSNLVKMRKARIIPIGWEIAAESSANSTTSSITLREVVDGFNDCNSDGQIDSGHPWCHLIDPNWVLKYPAQECLASMITAQTISSSSPGRSGACVDAPSCVVENDDGSCGGYGYCTREKNTWNFSGSDCPEELATCMAFTNSETSGSGAWLFSSLDQGLCSAGNAGCLWHRTNRRLDDAGTVDDVSDDAYEWLPGDDLYITANREDDILSYDSVTGEPSARATYYYDTDGGGAKESSYETYAYEDRIYFASEVESCTEDSAGCNELYQISDDLSLNLLRNASFEDNEDDNKKADHWNEPATPSTVFDFDESGSYAFDGDNSYKLGADKLSQTNLVLQPNTFYNLSFYAKGADASGGLTARLFLSAPDGKTSVDLTGYSSDCTSVIGDQVSLIPTSIETADFESFDCTFTTPVFDDERLWLVADLVLTGKSDTHPVFVDAVQLEARETPTTFHDGYNQSTPTADYLKTPPAWLGCEGKETDPAECDDYVTVCSATDVGCSLYSPADGDPDVPAVLADEDQCPEECAGYSVYKQEDSDYDTGEFPLYFIASTAEECSTTEVGCDEFTNLETEEVENFSYLRACVASDQTTDEAVFFTWEGSDNSGYQLVSFQLLVSNLNSGTVAYTQDADGDGKIDDGLVDDENPESAPCTNWAVGADGLSCDDSLSAIAATDDCNEHDDIFVNPDCREFYDSDGNVHYRLYSETVSITDDCVAYRKTDANSDDCTNSGGYYTSAGECRYFVYAVESTSCSAPGCREYTGGGSRNASTIFTEYFEDGSYENFENAHSSSNKLSISNESVAVDGHSLRVISASSGDRIITQQDFYNADHDECAASDGCDSLNSECAVTEGETGCGVLYGSLVVGKTFVVKFWAKGTGSLNVSMVDNGGEDDSHDFGEDVELTSGWQLYELGPLDTSDETDFFLFNENAVLAFKASSAGQIFYLDNIQLEQTEEDLTLVKDSWVTSSMCDETPDGVESDQYYLGCEEYTDQNDETFYIYQFSDLCSESAVGCEAYYETQNSASYYSQAFNLTCYNSDGLDSDTEPDVAAEATACYFDLDDDGISDEDEEVCTIRTGYDNCQFDYEGNLPTPLPEIVVMGPEAVVVPADEIKYLIADDEFSCTAENKGCIEVGEPTFSQDKTRVDSFESVYFLNQPDDYADTLCSNEELFCTEWASTEDGNFYFKDPGDKACEYKTGVSIDNVSYDGWFRSGTTEFCYGVGTCSVSGKACSQTAGCGVDEVCQINSGSYIVGGDFSGLWMAGDDDYDNWAGECQDQYDLCSEFIDPLDTKEGEEIGGKSYYYLDDKKIEAGDCNNQVGLQEGCALFNDTMNTELSYSASASYLVSEHADLFFGEDPRSLQDPVSCDDPEVNGIFSTTTGPSINVCQQRCLYEVNLGYKVENLTTAVTDLLSSASTDAYLGAACVYDSDCQTGIDSVGNEVEGTCYNLDLDGDGEVGDADEAVDLSDYISANDANQVISVYRDRECAEWLACSSSYSAWDDTQNKWTDVCEDLGLCDSFSLTGESGFCDSWVEQDAVVLSEDRYSSRDVSWYGLDYSGYAIPGQLSAELLDQFNINPQGYCTDEDITEIAAFTPCSSDSDCLTATLDTCTDVSEIPATLLREKDLKESDYYLVYNASSCAGDSGDSCSTGFCDDTGQACASDEECLTGSCLTGYCLYSDSDSVCSDDDDCVGNDPYLTCSDGFCVVETQVGCWDASGCSAYSDGECQPGALAKTGACYNDSCLVGLDGLAFNPDKGANKDCRGYPEADSPFPLQVVEDWVDPSDWDSTKDLSEILKTDWDLNSEGTKIEKISSAEELDVIPYNYVQGFDDANVCSPTPGFDNEANFFNDCDCSYDKVDYGNGLAKRYYPLRTSLADVLGGVCNGGNIPGAECTVGDDGFCGTGGTCEAPTRKDSVYGWDGYCLENDSAVQLYGSSDPDYRACLTWLPIDQLLGSRDAYANATEAGFALADSFFCGELGYFKDVRTSNIFGSDGLIENYSSGADHGDADIACADLDGAGTLGNCKDGGDTCRRQVYCPDGYFALMGSCAWNKTNKENAYADACRQGTFSDNDCPYICVPQDSVHETDGSDFGGDWQVGDSCSPPDSEERTSDFGTSVYEYDGEDGSDFDTAVLNYLDCVIAGVISNDNKYTVEDDDESSSDYRNLDLMEDYYVACQDLVQVSSADENVAWTNRLWSGGDFEIDDFDYSFNTERSWFGRAFSPEDSLEVFGVFNSSSEVDARPTPVAQCLYNSSGHSSVSYLPIGDESCEADITVGDINFSDFGEKTPRSYENFSITAGEGDAAACDDDSECQIYKCESSGGECFVGCAGDGDCEDFEGEDLGDCLENGYCESSFGGAADSAECEDLGGTWSSTKCDNGPFKDEYCTSNNDCNAGVECNNDVIDHCSQCNNHRCNWPSEDLDSASLSSSDSLEDINSRLLQLFAKSYNYFSFSNDDYEEPGDFSVDTYKWNVTATGDDEKTPSPPEIASVGACYGTDCLEDEEGKFSLNGVDGGDLEFVGGNAHVVLSFFAWADSDQMPIRDITVGWGDGDHASDMEWPSDDRVGTRGADSSYYKNHRGLKSEDEEVCGSENEWGYQSDACETAYISFQKDYFCSKTLAESLPPCEYADETTGRLSNSPCQDEDNILGIGPSKCVFQPRVHVKDNWGWCTGYCDANPDTDRDGSPEEETENCYDEECQTDVCPGGGEDCPDFLNGVDNPWINFDGYVIVDWQS